MRDTFPRNVGNQINYFLFWVLCGVRWYETGVSGLSGPSSRVKLSFLETDVSRLPICPIFNGHAVQGQSVLLVQSDPWRWDQVSQETSVSYHLTPHNNLEDERIQFNRGESLDRASETSHSVLHPSRPKSSITPLWKPRRKGPLITSIIERTRHYYYI